MGRDGRRVLGIEPWTSCLLSMTSTTELHTQSKLTFVYVFSWLQLREFNKASLTPGAKELL